MCRASRSRTWPAWRPRCGPRPSRTYATWSTWPSRGWPASLRRAGPRLGRRGRRTAPGSPPSPRAGRSWASTTTARLRSTGHTAAPPRYPPAPSRRVARHDLVAENLLEHHRGWQAGSADHRWIRPESAAISWIAPRSIRPPWDCFASLGYGLRDLYPRHWSDDDRRNPRFGRDGRRRRGKRPGAPPTPRQARRPLASLPLQRALSPSWTLVRQESSLRPLPVHQRQSRPASPPRRRPPAD